MPANDPAQPATPANHRAFLFKAIADNSRNIVGIKDLDGRYLYVNGEYPKLFGLPAETFVGKTDHQLFARALSDRYRANDLLIQQQQQSTVFEEQAMIDGELRHFLSVKFPVFDDDGTMIATGLIATDITERKQAEQRLWASQELFRLAFEHATVGIALVATDGTLLRVNPQLGKMFGYTPDALEGTNVNDLAITSDRTLSSEFIHRALAGEQESGVFDKRYRHKQGHVVYCRVSSALVREADGRPAYFISHVSDITESRRVEEELKRLANTDPLTGLANRRPFLEAMRQELARIRRFGTRASCLMLDFDHFKHINDRWGHSSGDAVLQHFSRLCQERLRASDLLGRLGGEEFAILMPGTPLEGARTLAEQLRVWIAEHPLHCGDNLIAYSVSMGVTELLAGDDSPDQVLARVDEALYRAKERGRDRVETA